MRVLEGLVQAIADAPGGLADDEIVDVMRAGLGREPLSGARVLVLVPDRTRTFPTARVASLLRRAVGGSVAALDYMVALGTHTPIPDAELPGLVGLGPGGHGTVFNHAWDDPGALATVGELSAAQVEEASGGRLAVAVPVRVNRRVLQYDRLVVLGPVFPHEVVGFSGGSKYIFPGVGGPELIDVSHWLGALLTSRAFIGRPGVTPMRRLIDLAADLVPVPKACCAFVTGGGVALQAACAGGLSEAWSAAAEASARLHVRRVPEAAERVISVVPPRYPDMWTGAKAMYKVEPIVADGGEIVLYAPHARTFSEVHGEILQRVGFHVRDYYLHRWDQVKSLPWKVLAYSTLLKGDGAFDPATGEWPRISVVLATSIGREECIAHNLGYEDPAVVRRWIEGSGPQADGLARAPDGALVVPEAGESLYRLEGDLP